MDNLSHSVVGLAVGELVHRSLPKEADASRQHNRRRLLLVSCWAASNFPDLDYFLTPLIPAPLGYLLHHRGHTHTLLYVMPQAILLLAMIWLLWPAARKLLRQSGSARRGVILTLSLGFVLHLLMDYLNSYGIHPFHPFDSRWLYGDMVFILEPWFWIACGVPLAMMVPRRSLQVLLLATLIGIPFFFTLKAYLPRESLVVLVILGATLGVLQQKAGVNGKGGLIAALGLSIGFVGVQGFASGQAKQVVVETLQLNDAASVVLDAAMTSFPANPLCWTFVSVESNERAGTYRLRRGIVSLAPNRMPVSMCPTSLVQRPFQKGDTPAIAFVLEVQGNLAMLRKLKSDNCHFEAWLRFARAPALGLAEATDIRFGENPEKNFTTINFDDFSNRECPRFIPGWGFPRSDLLTPPGLPSKR